MDEQIKEQILLALKAANQNIPNIVQELVSQKSGYHASWAGVFFIVFLFSIIGARKLYKLADDNETRGVVIFIGIPLVAGTFFAAFYNFFTGMYPLASYIG